MKFGDMDICNLPLWMGQFVDDILSKCGEALKDSNQYNRLTEEGSELLERYRFISMLADRDDIRQPLNLSVEEAKALSRFMAIDDDKKEIEKVQMYLLGFRHMLEMLELLGMI